MHGYTIAALVGALLIGGVPIAWAASADTVATPTPGDPWERTNRTAYAFEDALDRHAIRPLAKLYRWLTPGPIGRGLHNVIVNLSEPAAFINDVLQFRLKRAGVPAARFIANSTIGLLGLFDVASHTGLVHHNNEFGVTLGRYGLTPGPYLYVPLIGPTTVRDVIGSSVDFLIDPIHSLRYDNRTQISNTRIVVNGLDTRVRTEDQLDALLSGAVDPYATLRSVYLQNKQGEIEGGTVPAALPDFDEPAPADNEPSSAPSMPDPPAVPPQ